MQTLVIEFDEYPEDNVEVIISPVPVSDLFGIVNQVRALRMNEDSFRALFAAFVPFIEGWSWADEVSVESLMARDYNLVLAVINAWVAGVRDVPLPLPRASSDTEPSTEP